MFGHSAWDTSRIGFSAEVRKTPRSSAQTRVFRATTNGVGVETRKKPGSDIDCVVGEWSAWQLVGDGCQQIRMRKIIVEPACNGRDCPALEEKREVGSTDSVWKWGEWTEVSGDPCQEMRVRVLVSKATCGGNENDPPFDGSNNDSDDSDDSEEPISLDE
jgi:hypothetical protein